MLVPRLSYENESDCIKHTPPGARTGLQLQVRQLEPSLTERLAYAHQSGSSNADPESFLITMPCLSPLHSGCACEDLLECRGLLNKLSKLTFHCFNGFLDSRLGVFECFDLCLTGGSSVLTILQQLRLWRQEVPANADVCSQVSRASKLLHRSR